MSKPWHIATKDEIEDELNTDFERGMTNEFAQSTLKQQMSESGKKMPMRPKSAMVCFSSVMAILLVILSVLFMFWGKPVLGTTVVALVFISEILGFAQDIVSLKKEQKVKNLLVHKVVVIRDGQQKVVFEDEIAQGDIVVLSKGDIVPCDGRITYADGLKIDESAVTGIEGTVKKDCDAELSEVTELKDRTNMLFKGSFIVSGNCRMVACEVGENTALAEIEKDNPKCEEKSYMQDKLSEVGKVLSVTAFVLLAALFAICILSGADGLESAMLCLTLGAVLVPSKMHSVISYIVSCGTLKIADGGSVLKSEAVAEKLALCDVVLTGKSGIITDDKAKAYGVFTSEGDWTLNDMGMSAAEKSILRIILEFGAVCTQPEKEKNIEEEFTVDSAVLEAAGRFGINTKNFEIAKRYPFDMNRKLMTVAAKAGDGYRIITKGDLNEVINRCSHAVSSTSLNEMTEELKASLTEKCSVAAEGGFKTVAVAYKDTNELLKQDLAESGLIFVGAIILENELRKDSIKAVRELVLAGIKPVMVTYDNAKLAEHIASQCAILREGSILINGEELAAMSDSELDEKIENVSVFAQLHPEDKIRVLESYKRAGKTVCMISDSAHDKKALEAADISVSKTSGADVASSQANVVTDGAFSSFVNTVKQAQKLYLDVRKSLRFLISCSIAQILFVIIAMLITNKMPLSAVQVLAIGILVSGVLPFALPFGGEWESLKLKNVKMQNSIFSKMWTRIIAGGVVLSLIALVMFIVMNYFVAGLSDASALRSARTAVVLFFVLSALIYVLYLRKKTATLKESKKELMVLALTVALYVILILVALFVPNIRKLFGFETKNFAAVFVVSLIPAVLGILADVFKGFKSKIKKTEDVNGTDI